MDAELAQDQAEIEKLAVDINNAIVGVPDVDQILADTADNVLMAGDLKNEAEAVQKEAKTQLDIAEKIIRELSNAAVSQDAAEEAVIQTRNDIDSARTNLGQVSYFLNANPYLFMWCTIWWYDLKLKCHLAVEFRTKAVIQTQNDIDSARTI